MAFLKLFHTRKDKVDKKSSSGRKDNGTGDVCKTVSRKQTVSSEGLVNVSPNEENIWKWIENKKEIVFFFSPVINLCNLLLKNIVDTKILAGLNGAL